MQTKPAGRKRRVSPPLIMPTIIKTKTKIGIQQIAMVGAYSITLAALLGTFTASFAVLVTKMVSSQQVQVQLLISAEPVNGSGEDIRRAKLTVTALPQNGSAARVVMDHAAICQRGPRDVCVVTLTLPFNVTQVYRAAVENFEGKENADYYPQEIYFRTNISATQTIPIRMSRTNLLPNSSFESPIDRGWGLALDVGATMYTTNNPHLYGSASGIVTLVVQAGRLTNGVFRRFTVGDGPADLRPVTTYKLSAWLQATVPLTDVYVKVKNGGMEQRGNNVAAFPIDEFHRSIVYFTTPSAADIAADSRKKTVDVYLGYASGQGSRGAIFVDDVSLALRSNSPAGPRLDVYLLPADPNQVPPYSGFGQQPLTRVIVDASESPEPVELDGIGFDLATGGDASPWLISNLTMYAGSQAAGYSLDSDIDTPGAADSPYIMFIPDLDKGEQFFVLAPGESRVLSLKGDIGNDIANGSYTISGLIADGVGLGNKSTAGSSGAGSASSSGDGAGGWSGSTNSASGTLNKKDGPGSGSGGSGSGSGGGWDAYCTGSVRVADAVPKQSECATYDVAAVLVKDIDNNRTPNNRCDDKLVMKTLTLGYGLTPPAPPATIWTCFGTNSLADVNIFPAWNSCKRMDSIGNTGGGIGTSFPQTLIYDVPHYLTDAEQRSACSNAQRGFCCAFKPPKSFCTPPNWPGGWPSNLTGVVTSDGCCLVPAIGSPSKAIQDFIDGLPSSCNATITATETGCHGRPGSDHYNGCAVDLQLPGGKSNSNLKNNCGLNAGKGYKKGQCTWEAHKKEKGGGHYHCNVC